MIAKKLPANRMIYLAAADQQDGNIVAVIASLVSFSIILVIRLNTKTIAIDLDLRGSRLSS